MSQGDQAVAMQPKPNEGRALPTTFDQGFDAAFSEGRLFGQSIAGENARADALQDHLNDLEQKTGKNVAASIDWSGMAAGGAMTADMLREQTNTEAEKLGQPPLSADDLEQAAVAKSRQAQTSYADVSAQEKTLGGSLGMFAGGAASAATDPINLLALPVAPETEAVSILGAALRWGAVAGVSQAAIEATGAPYREEVQPGYAQSGAPVSNVLEAAGGGMVLGGATKALGNAWTRVKTGAWPTSVRDAGNVIESHANIADTNVYQGAEGEAAHWDAMNFSIDAILKGDPVDVSHIITPQMEAQSRNIMARLEGERAASLPIFDERAIRLTSEEAGLRARDTELASHVEGLPEGNVTSADRLNRLQAVDQQIAAASDPAVKRALSERRDQILVDTTPERLQAEAAPIEQRRTAQNERASIASRLDEITNERARIQVENLSAAGPPSIGQAQPVRAVPLEQIRAASADAARAAETARAATGEATPELPFAATAAEGHAQAVQDALVSGVRQIAQKAGYAMPAEEAATIAGRLAKATPDEASDLMRDLQMSPRQVAEAPTKIPAEPAVEPREPVTDPAKAMASPDYQDAVRADIDRERMTADRQIPVDIDKDGEPVYRSLDGAMNEVDAYKNAADQIAACAAPAAEAAEEAA